MIDPSTSATRQGERSGAMLAQTQLDALVVTVELTLISIIQGVALSFLAGEGRGVVVGLRLEFWPYVATGLMTILLFWSRSVAHTLTVIRWPLEFAHNFMYVACTLVQAVLFTQLASPVGWYGLGAGLAVLIWALFVLDLSMIRKRIQDSPGATADRLYRLVEAEQLRNIRMVMPAIVVFSLAAALAVRLWPEAMLQRRGHVVIALAQMVGTAGYLTYTVRFFGRVTPLLVGTRDEWRDDVIG
jgi:hypothetical protein